MALVCAALAEVGRACWVTDCEVRPACLCGQDRPSLAIYRPGMGKYSSRRLRERDSESPTGGAEGEEQREQRAAPLPRTLVFRRSRAAAE